MKQTGPPTSWLQHFLYGKSSQNAGKLLNLQPDYERNGIHRTIYQHAGNRT